MGFAFDEVCENLDGESKRDEKQEALLVIVNRLVEWLYPRGCRKGTLQVRGFVLVWVIRPEWLDSPTQVEMARRLGLSKQSFGKVVNQLRDEFGFYVPGMRHDEAREKFRQHARAGAERLAEARRKAHARKHAA